MIKAIKKIEAGPKGGRIVFSEQPNIDHMRLIQLVQSRPKDFKLDQAAGALNSALRWSTQPGASSRSARW